MTSSDQPKLRATHIVWPLLIVIALAVLYSAGWFAFAHFVEKRGRNIIVHMARAGRHVACEKSSVQGFPFHFGVDCRSVQYADEKKGLSLTAAAMTASTPVYDPFQTDLVFHSPSTITQRQGPTFHLAWTKLDTGMTFDLSKPNRATLDTDDIDVQQSDGSSAAAPLLQVKSIEGAAKANGNDLDVSADFSGVAFGSALAQMSGLPPLSGTGEMRIVDGATILATGIQTLRNRHIYIDKLELDPGSGSKAAVAGALSFDDDGLANGTLRVSVENPAGLSNVLAQAFPREANKIQTAFSLIGAMGKSPVLPVELHHGKVIVGFFKIGKIPPVK